MEQNTVNPTLRRLAFALAALSATAPSWAVLAAEPRSEDVHYGDLNLATQAGVDVLDRRLDRAVERVCGDSSVRNLAQQRVFDRCYEATWNAIQPDREVAIARAGGQHDGTTAVAASSSGRTRVTRAE